MGDPIVVELVVPYPQPICKLTDQGGRHRMCQEAVDCYQKDLGISSPVFHVKSDEQVAEPSYWSRSGSTL